MLCRCISIVMVIVVLITNIVVTAINVIITAHATVVVISASKIVLVRKTPIAIIIRPVAMVVGAAERYGVTKCLIGFAFIVIPNAIRFGNDMFDNRCERYRYLQHHF